MEAESNLAEVAVSNNGATSGEPQDPTVLKEKLADELKSAASLKGGGDGSALDVPLEKDDLLERLEKIETDSSEAVNKPAGGGTAASVNDADMENDDLIQRLEAIEKGEEEAASDATVEQKKQEAAAGATEAAGTNHQNGLDKDNEEQLLQDDDSREKEGETMEVDSVDDKKDEVSSTAPTSNGASSFEQTESPTSSIKRRHSQDEESQTTEPSSKKVHVDEEVDSAKQLDANEEKSDEKAVEPSGTETKEEVVKDAVDKVEESTKPEEVVEESTAVQKETKQPEIVESVDDIEKESEQTVTDDTTLPDEKHLEEKSSPEVKSNEKEDVVKAAEVLKSGKDTEPDTKEVENTTAAEKKESGESSATPLAECSEATVESEKPLEPKTKSDADKKQEETNAKEIVESVSEEKSAEPKLSGGSATAVVGEEQEKNEDAKETVVKLAEEPTTSDPVTENPKSSEESQSVPESLTEQPTKEAESKGETDPDTEPNTESPLEEQPTSSSPAVVEERSDEAISSSSEQKEEQVVPSSTEVDSAVPEQIAQKPSEIETVTSSDEKPPAEPTVSQAVDSTPEVDATTAEASKPAEDDEPMEVDSEPVVGESSQVDASEPPCTKKEAYECTDKSEKESPEAKPQEPAVELASESTSAPVPEKESSQKLPEQEVEKMDVDSAAPSQSKADLDVTESLNTTSEELIESLAKDDTSTAADSQSDTAATVSEHNKNMDAGEATAEDSKVDASKTLDDSIECSLPTSSSDKMADRLKQRLDLISNGSSTPNAAVSSSNVYNSTPIQKQFEISSENVSKISRHSDSHQTEEDHSAITVGDQSIADEKEAAVASTSGVSKPPAVITKQSTDTSDDTSVTVKDESSSKTESSEVDSCTASSALNTADEINMYAANARKFNGISSTSGSELEEKATVTQTNVSTTDTPSTVVHKLDLSTAVTSEETLYEVSVWFDGSELQFLSVEKLDNKSPASIVTAGSTQDLTGIDSSKQSSNGSVGSLGPFSLPPARPATDSAMSHSTATESSSGNSQIKTSLPKMKHTVRGAKALATLMIDEFTKIKRALSKEDDVSDAEPATPMKTPRGRPPASAKKATTATPASARGQKRSRTDSETTEEEPPKSKQPAKQAKKGAKTEAEVPETAEPPVKKEDEQCCLARWSDRKYYAGKVAGFKGDNKYMIIFEDGASKALSKDVIVFGEKDTLPIVGHPVHALTGDDTYETGIVQEFKRNDSNEVVYSVKVESDVVEVTASDLYLTEEQARIINKACKAAESAADEKNTSMQSPQTTGRRGANTPVMQTPEEATATSAEKGSRSSRRRGADKPQTPVTPEAGYSGGVGKKGGRRGRRLS
ncbi:microtubule-associated protein futsch-like isoform X2 [Armigeres subalbatus]|uniref:microtubule-associated protein futsch-like isoform X2 n=1 Tax=Armigeres subalbatus TaxID=124917 RepID=UPI002ED4846A